MVSPLRGHSAANSTAAASPRGRSKHRIPRPVLSGLLLRGVLPPEPTDPKPAEPPAKGSRIEIPRAPPGSTHRLSLSEIVLQRGIEELAIAPDGQAKQASGISTPGGGR